MKFYADLHIHSRYSRATSQDLTLENLYLWAQLKGLSVVTTGDCIHPAWFKEIKEKLEPAEEGLFKLKPQFTKEVETKVPQSCRSEVRFILSTEISNIYKKKDKVRKIHNVIVLKDFAATEKLQSKLEAIGNIRSDGRPILGLDARDLLEIVLETDQKSIFIPAHIWTPWFSVLGSKSGFDSLEECFEDLTKHIFAVETGLSSDPAMNWRLSQLDKFVLVSNSDAHSPAKLAREATIFDTDLSYQEIYAALSDGKNKGLVGTLEFFPEEGKYHFDGHRNCEARLSPQESKKNKGLCPVCGRPVTVGVMARVEELADRKSGDKPKNAKPFYNLIPLQEVIAEAKSCSTVSKQVGELYQQLLFKLGNEVYILMDAPLKDIEKCAGDMVAEGIKLMREGKVQIAAGYDGEYGKINLFSEEDRTTKESQLNLF